MERRAKIVATVGPASSGEDVLAHLFDEGVDIVRLNLSHGDHESHRRLIRRVRRQADAQCRFVPILLDLMGPRYRLGEVPGGPRMLDAGTEVELGESAPGVELPVEDPSFLDHLQAGERILIDNGLVALRILDKRHHRVRARVENGGPVATRKGINLPDTDLPFTISDKDRSDVAFAVGEGADFLAVSFVGAADDLEAVRAVVEEAGGNLPLVAKLERATAVRHLEAIVESADAVMVARGDLGVEVPIHRVPVLQKRIVAAGRHRGKPVIVATQMLESMMERPRPTRAEATDCANAVFDGADALMLSGETAAGAYPVESVRTMAEIIREAEAHQPRMPAPALPGTLEGDRRDDRNHPARHLRPGVSEEAHLNTDGERYLEIPEVVAAAAVYATDQLDVGRIVAFSQGGFTARMIARYRPRTPITVFTLERSVAHRVQLLWGVRPFLMQQEIEHHDEVVSLVDRLLLDAGLASPGDTIIILMGDPIRERPLTNLMRVHRVRA